MENGYRIETISLKLRKYVTEWQWAERYVFPILRPSTNLEELSMHLVTRRYLDLRIYYIIRYPLNQEHTLSVKITEGMLEGWGITLKVLHEAALRNLQEDGYYIEGMLSACRELLGIKVDNSELDLEDEMYVLLNPSKNNGAAGMLYIELIREFAEKRGSDLFILPSSIHELILVPDNGCLNHEMFEEMIGEINEGQVEESERLGNHAYYYSRNEGIIRPAA